MAWFEPGSSGFGSDRAANCATTTAHQLTCLFHSNFHRRLITHTSKLLEEKQENLCVKILQTLKEMLAVDTEYGEKVKAPI